MTSSFCFASMVALIISGSSTWISSRMKGNSYQLESYQGRPGTTSSVQWMSVFQRPGRGFGAGIRQNSQAECPGIGIRLGPDLALPGPCCVTLTKFISQSRFSHLVNEDSNLPQAVENYMSTWKSAWHGQHWLPGSPAVSGKLMYGQPSCSG